MNKSTKPSCGHSVLRAECQACRALLEKWYLKISASDPDWRDIEYGLDTPQLIYQPVDISTIDELTTAYYDKVWGVYHAWVKDGRSKRDCMVCELLAQQDGDTGTERGISGILKSKRLKPNSRFAVRQTIKEIDSIVLQIAQRRQVVEQARALHALDSKPLKEDTNGETVPLGEAA